MKVATTPFQNLPTVRFRGEGGEVKGDEAAAALHLALDDSGASGIEEMRRLLKLVPITPVRDNHDRVRIVERVLILRPAIEVNFRADLIADVGAAEQHFEQFHGPRIVMDAVTFGTVTFLARDEDNLLFRGRRFGCGQRYARQQDGQRDEAEMKTDGRFHG